MARYIREVELNRPEEFVQYIMTDFLGKQGFQMKEFKGELVYRAGNGLLEIPKFLTWGYQNGRFHIEAWTRNCWLPGVYGRENALDGFMGCIPKEAYKKDIEALIGLLFQPLAQSEMPEKQGNPGTPVMSQNPRMNVQQPIYVRGTDMSRYATMALVFSLVGIVCTCLSGILGLIWGSLGIVYGKKAMNSQKKGMATAAFVIGIVTDVLAGIVCVLKIILAISQMV